MKDVRALLEKADLQLSMLTTLYTADLELQRISPTLRFKVKAFLDTERAALDKLAEGVVVATGAGEGHIHYPLAAHEAMFETSVDKHMPGVREARPDLAATIARHQPFSVPPLAQLRELLRDENRQKLTPETSPAPPEPEVVPEPEPAPVAAAPKPPPPQGGLGAGLTGPMFINGVEYDPMTLAPINPTPPARRETVYVDWHFQGQEASALHTLQEIQGAVAAAVDEVAAAAGLQQA